MLERMDGKLGENHSGELHRETAEQKANRTTYEELTCLGWPESDFAMRRRSDPGKLALADRLRKETTLPVKWVAMRVQIGTTKGTKSMLHHLAHGKQQGKAAKASKSSEQLEFQSTVWRPGSFGFAEARRELSRVKPLGRNLGGMLCAEFGSTGIRGCGLLLEILVHGLHPIMHAQLPINAPQVIVYCPDADSEEVSDFLVQMAAASIA